jgi:hypothetical protein
MRPPNSHEVSSRLPEAVKSRWLTPGHGTCSERRRFIVRGVRKSSRSSRSATTIANRPLGVK